MARRPRDGVLLALAICTVASVAIGSESGVGTYAMFTEPMQYRLDALTRAEDGFPTRLTLRELRPHLSRDARRVLGGAHRWIVGETNTRLLRDGLPDLARLVCALRPDAHLAEVRLDRRTLEGEPRPSAAVRLHCASRPRAR